MAQIVLVAQPTPNGISLGWYDGPAAFAPYEVPRKTVALAADAARKALGAVVECSFAEEPGDAATVAAALAAAGYGLYQALFKPAAEQVAQANDVRKWLDKLQTDGAGDTLEVVTEGIEAVPWNLVYDKRPNPKEFQSGGADPARWQPFWGLRYDLSGGRRVSPLRRFSVLRDPRVLVVSDPFVLDNLPAESRALTALCNEHNWPHARSRDELAEAFRDGRPDILYWLGHTQTEPFGLVLGEDVITPDDLKTLLEGDPFADAKEVFGGVAFLNACSTAGQNATGTFPDALHPLGLSGYIATEQVTVDTFAAPLGREFLTAFAVRGEPLGQVMRTLRGQVPLGLLYGSYCPPMIHVRRGEAVAEAAAVVLTAVARGTKLGRTPGADRGPTAPLPTHPYRSLRAYGVDDRALFAGRDADALRFAQVLDDPGTRVLILHGESGVGKTSFLRAGVIPYLENECVGYKFTRDRGKDGDAILLIRATNDPVAQIATALLAYCARPLVYKNPFGDEVAADLPGVLRAALNGVESHDALRQALRADPTLFGRILAELARALPFTPVLIIDQAEEVFTLARTPHDEENRTQALEMLRRAANGPGGFKLVVSLRTEYHGRFVDRLRSGSRDNGVREYLLTDFGLDALIDVIRRPTSQTPIEFATEVPFEKYRFRYADGVAEEIAGRARAYTINRSDSVLPLIQVICTQLYDRARSSPDADPVITLADLDAIGGVEGGMRAHAEGLVRRLFPQRADQTAFRALLADPETQLFLRQSDGTLTTALLPAAFLARHWQGRSAFEDVLRTSSDGDWRLLRVNSLRIGSDDREQPYVSLGHDALARVAADWADALKRTAQRRQFARIILGMLVVGMGLTALTALAWYKSERAKASEALAVQSAREAREATEAADRNRAAAEAEHDAAVASGRAALSEKVKAQEAEKQTVEWYKVSTDDAIDLIDGDADLGLKERNYLEETKKNWEKLAKRAQEGDDARAKEIRAEGQQRVAALAAKLAGRDKELLGQALKEYTTARDRWAELASAPSGTTNHRLVLAQVHIRIGRLHDRRGDLTEAFAEYDTADQMLNKLVRDTPQPTNPAYISVQADVNSHRGVLYSRQASELEESRAERKDEGRTKREVAELRDKAEAAYGKAREFLERLPGVWVDGDRMHRRALAVTFSNLGLLRTLIAKGSASPEKWAEAEADFEHAAALQQRLADQFPDVLEYRVALGKTYNNWGVMLNTRVEQAQGRDRVALSERARAQHEEARKIWETLSRQSPNVREYRTSVARSHLNSGLTYLSDNDARLRCFTNAIDALHASTQKDARTKSVEQESSELVLRESYSKRARELAQRGAKLEAQQDWDGARKLFLAAKADWDRAVELSPPAEVGACRVHRALVQLRAGAVGEAVTEVNELTKEWNWSAEQWYDFACIYAAAGNRSNTADERRQRVQHYERALDMLRRAVAAKPDAGFDLRAALDKNKQFFSGVMGLKDYPTIWTQPAPTAP